VTEVQTQGARRAAIAVLVVLAVIPGLLVLTLYVAIVALGVSALDENFVGSMAILGVAAVPLVLLGAGLVLRKRPQMLLTLGLLAAGSVVLMLVWLMWGWWSLGQ
jgi:hypothetical protein